MNANIFAKANQIINTCDAAYFAGLDENGSPHISRFQYWSRQPFPILEQKACLGHINHQKSEAKRWEGNYNNLYSHHIRLKRDKGLDIE